MNQRKKQFIALLSAALVIASAPAISANIPAIKESFPNVNSTFINLFTTIPSLFIIFGVFLTNILERKVDSKKIILVGLSIVIIFGTLPVWYSNNFQVLFLSRCVLGLGIGLFNRLVLQNVSMLYQDSPSKKARAIGLESASEGLGGILMVVLVGQLVKISWQTSFLVYGIALIGFVLILFIFPKDGNMNKTSKITSQENISKHTKAKMIRLSILLFCIVGFFIIFNLQITPLLIEKKIGNSTQGSNMIAGISIGAFLAGNFFGKTYHLFQNKILPIACLFAGLFILLTTKSTSLTLTLLCSAGLGFSFRNIMPFFTHLFTSNGNKAVSNFGTTAILISYNLGATLAPYFVKVINYVGFSTPSSILQFSSFFFIVIFILTLMFNKKISVNG